MKKIHFIGIGGSGMSAVASIAREMGYVVTGCETVLETKPNKFTTALQKQGLLVWYESDLRHLDGIDLVCVTPAVQGMREIHPEIVEAIKKGIPVVTWQEFMGQELQIGRKVLGVAGTKGKTTTTTLMGLLLEQAGFDPIVEVGANVAGWGRNYRIGDGEWFVCEADEFNRSFLNYQCDIAVITNIEMDHPEFFRNYEEYQEAYRGFVEIMKGQQSLLIANLDSSGVQELLQRVKNENDRLITYGKGKDAQYQLLSYKYDQSKCKSEFVIRRRNKEPELITSALVGEHNALNVLSVIAVAEHLGITITVVQEMLENVRAPERRFEESGQAQSGATLVNDYAHTPASILATIKAAKERYPAKIIWAVWQPHMYTRTKMLLDDFCKALIVADEVVVLPVFASRESGSELAKEISAGFLANKIGHNSYAAESLEDAANYLNNRTNSNAVVINMGAGDNSRIIDLMKGKLND